MSLIAYSDLCEQAWSRLERAADDPEQPMRLMVMATVAADRPDARTMVLRGANRDLGRLWFYTDARSEKVAQLRAQPVICAVGYDGRDGVQLRIHGRASLHEDTPLADRHWSQLSMRLQQVYASPEPPGRPLPQPDPRLMRVGSRLQAGEEEAARRNFTVIELAVTALEWLQVREQDQRRAVMHAATAWSVQPVAP